MLLGRADLSSPITCAPTLTHENGADILDALPYNAKITVTAGEANERFECIRWYQTSGVRLTEAHEYSRTMNGNFAIEAGYRATANVVAFDPTAINGQNVRSLEHDRR